MTDVRTIVKPLWQLPPSEAQNPPNESQHFLSSWPESSFSMSFFLFLCLGACGSQGLCNRSKADACCSLVLNHWGTRRGIVGPVNPPLTPHPLVDVPSIVKARQLVLDSQGSVEGGGVMKNMEAKKVCRERKYLTVQLTQSKLFDSAASNSARICPWGLPLHSPAKSKRHHMSGRRGLDLLRL